MTNRLELNWKLDGFVDEQRYYCSETPIDTQSPPIPKMVLSNTVRSYTDIDIEVGKTYYVCVSSVKNNVEKFSDVLTAVVKNIVTSALLHFNDDLTDESGKFWTARGNAAISSEQSVSGGKSLKLNGGSIATTNNLDFDFADEDFTIEFFVNLGISFSGWGMAIAKRNSGANYSPFLIAVNISTNSIYFALSTTGSTWDVFDIFNGVLTAGQNHVAFCRSGTKAFGFVRGTKLLDKTISSAPLMTNTNAVTIGANDNGGEAMRGYIDEMKITKGHALYTSNFVPSSSF